MNKSEIFTARQIKKFNTIHFMSGIRNGLRLKVKEKGFDVDSLRDTVNSAAVNCYGNSIEGLCMKNVNGGYYFFSEGYTPQPIFLKREGSVVVNVSTKSTRVCCLFWDMFDFMAYRTLYRQDRLNESIPIFCDSVIIGSANNFVSAMLDCECYEKVYMLLPNSVFGRTMALTITSPDPIPCRNRHNCIDMSEFYHGFTSLYEFMRYSEPFNKKNQAI